MASYSSCINHVDYPDYVNILYFLKEFHFRYHTRRNKIEQSKFKFLLDGTLNRSHFFWFIDKKKEKCFNHLAYENRSCNEMGEEIEKKFVISAEKVNQLRKNRQHKMMGIIQWYIDGAKK